MRVTINVGQTKETLVMREGDQPECVAKEFAGKFNLTQEIECQLSRQIEDSLVKLNSSKVTQPEEAEI